jgi:hypothetical protein
LSIGLACVICVGRVADVPSSCLAALISALPPLAELLLRCRCCRSRGDEQQRRKTGEREQGVDGPQPPG